MVLFLLANASLHASEIDSLYNVFLASKGEMAINVANEIAVMTGDTVCFTEDISVEQMNEAVLKKLIFWHFDRSEMTEVVNYAKIAIDSYEERGDLSSPSPLVSQPVVLLTQIAFTLALAKEMLPVCAFAALGAMRARSRKKRNVFLFMVGVGIKGYKIQKLVSVAGKPATETGITITNVLLLLYEAQDAVAAAHEVEARG